MADGHANSRCRQPSFLGPEKSAVEESRLTELWVRYCQTGIKWGKEYPPLADLSRLCLSSQFSGSPPGNPPPKPPVGASEQKQVRLLTHLLHVPHLIPNHLKTDKPSVPACTSRYNHIWIFGPLVSVPDEKGKAS